MAGGKDTGWGRGRGGGGDGRIGGRRRRAGASRSASPGGSTRSPPACAFARPGKKLLSPRWPYRRRRGTWPGREGGRRAPGAPESWPPRAAAGRAPVALRWRAQSWYGRMPCGLRAHLIYWFQSTVLMNPINYPFSSSKLLYITTDLDHICLLNF